MPQKTLRIELSPEVRSRNSAKLIGGMVFSAFERAFKREPIEDYLNKDGNLRVDVTVGEKEKE